MYCCSYHNLSHDVKYILYSKTVEKLQLFLKICKYIMQKTAFSAFFLFSPTKPIYSWGLEQRYEEACHQVAAYDEPEPKQCCEGEGLGARLFEFLEGGIRT